MNRWGILVFSTIVLALFSCGEDDYLPKPTAYFRIDLPEKDYQKTDFDCPYQFEIPTYAKWEFDEKVGKEKCWVNVVYPRFDAKIHMSYKPVENNLVEYLDDARQLTNKHIPKAAAIEEQLIYDEEARVFGLAYNVKGTGAASTMQFFVTDSSNHFLRGALYFNVSPNNDSLAPVIDFIKEDIEHLIETLEWRE